MISRHQSSTDHLKIFRQIGNLEVTKISWKRDRLCGTTLYSGYPALSSRSSLGWPVQ